MQLESRPFIELWLIYKVFIQNLKGERTSNSPVVFWLSLGWKTFSGVLECYCSSENVVPLLFTRIDICGTINSSYIPKSMCSLLWFKLILRSECLSVCFGHFECQAVTWLGQDYSCLEHRNVEREDSKADQHKIDT